MITLSLLAACVLQCYAAQQDVLVLVEDASVRSTHSVFLDDLRQQGWKVTVKSAEDKTLRLRDWDDWLYSKIAIFASSIPGQSLLVGSGKLVLPDVLWMKVVEAKVFVIHTSATT